MTSKILLQDILRNHRLRLFGAFSTFLVKHAPAWAFPIVTAYMIDLVGAFIAGNEMQWSKVYLSGGILLAMILQNLITHPLYIRFTSSIVRRLETDLRGALVQRIQYMGFLAQGRFREGAFHSKILRDVETVGMMIVHGLNGLFPAILTILIALTMTLAKEPFIAIFYVVTVPIAALIRRVYQDRINSGNAAFRTELERMTSLVSEMLHMVPITRAHGLQGMEVEKLRGQFEKVRSKGQHIDLINAFFNASAWVLLQLFQFSCLILAVYLAFIQRISIGDVVLYQGFFVAVVGSVTQILNIFPELAKGMESLRSVAELLSSDDFDAGGHGGEMESIRGELQLEGVSFFFHHDVGVRDITLHLPSGINMAVVGSSGAGKSTLINLMLGLFHPQKGRILVDGKELKEVDLCSYRRHIALVPQKPVLFDATVRENLCYGITPLTDVQIHEFLMNHNLQDVLHELSNGLDTQVGEMGRGLSGGQQQRLAIIRALMRDPKIIFLDEPTSSLDVLSERKIQAALEQLSKGRTTITVAHRLSTITKADLIIVMENGIIIEQGDFKSLERRGGAFTNMIQAYSAN